MSHICMVVIDFARVNVHVQRAALEKSIEQYHSRCFFLNAPEYKESFVYNYTDSYVTFLSDTPQFANCERLLCPDWCNTDDMERPPLLARITEVQQFLDKLLQITHRVDVWIGESGGAYEEYEEIELDVQHLTDALIKQYHSYGRIPDVHFILSPAV